MIIKARFGYLTQTLACMSFKIIWLRLHWHRWTRELHSAWHLKGWPPTKNCIIATTTHELFETHGYNMLNQKNQHRRRCRKDKITNWRTCLSIREGTPLIRLELQGPGPNPNLMQDVTPTPPMFSLGTTTKRPTPSSTASTTPSSPYKKGKCSMDNS